jgi:hypothetical protein
MIAEYRSVAQWLEHWSPKPAVGGSSPSTPARFNEKQKPQICLFLFNFLQ